MPNWIAVASTGYVQKDRLSGFMQVCHGKGAPLQRMKPNDWGYQFRFGLIAINDHDMQLIIKAMQNPLND